MKQLPLSCHRGTKYELWSGDFSPPIPAGPALIYKVLGSRNTADSI